MGSRVVVTGASGYLGRHVVKRLLVRGHDVVTISRSPDSWLEREVGSSSTIEQSAFELRTEHWDRIADADVVIHLAWRDGFALRSHAHGEDLSDHYRFLMQCLEHGVTKVAPVGTMHEIGYWEGAVSADTPSNPTTPYGIAKHALRRLLETSIDDPTRLAWLRCYYILGDDQRSKSIFSKILAADAAGEAEFPFTTGKNLYDFIAVEDLAHQIVAAAVDPDAHGVIDCGSGAPVSLADAVEGFISDRGLKIRLAYGAFPDRPFDSPGVWAEASHAKEIALRDTRIEQETP